MKYFFLLIIMSSFGFMFYKGLKIDPSIVPSNLIDEETPNFQLKKGGEYLSLISPNGDKSEISKTKYPKQRSNISFGLPLSDDGTEGEFPTFLAFPTPGRKNTGTHVGSLSTI